MISTVTTSTVAIAMSATIAGSVALICIIFLLLLFAQKEFITPAEDNRYRNMEKLLNISILPLFIAFITIVITRIVSVFH
jgi:hypothetical protein